MKLNAAPTTATQAENVVRGWLKVDMQPLGMSLGQHVTNVETFSDANEQPIYYVVYLQTSGFVIVPADDLVEPIIAFVDEGIYDPSPDNPLGALVSNDLPGRITTVRSLQIVSDGQSQKGQLTKQLRAFEGTSIKARGKWVELQNYANTTEIKEASNFEAVSGDSVVTIESSPLSDISDIRVAPLVKSKWGQGSVCGHDCYDYYTPYNYPCGCVATAMAQVIRFHEYPIEGIGVHPFTIFVGGGCFSGDPQTAYTRGGDGAGGRYNWSDMVFDPNCTNYADERWEAIGALCYDAGISMGTNYNSDGSCSSSSKAKTALNEVFGYSNAVVVPCIGVEQNELNDMINTNLDANYPVILGIGSQGSGHEVVADGYGYDFSTIYHHVNMGWRGNNDAWYNLPDPGVAFFIGVDNCIYNIFRTGSGEIISGRVRYEDESPISGATVSADTSSQTYNANTNDKGIYALTKVPSNTTFMISVSKDGYTFVPQSVATGYSNPNAEHVYSPAGNRWEIDFQGVSGSHPVIQLSAEEFEFTAIEGGFNPEPQILSIWNGAFETLDWVITDDCNWLQVEPNSGSSSGESNEVTFSVDTTNLIHGSYSCELTVSDPCALNNPQTIEVVLHITNELEVPDQYPTIQAAIDAAGHGCTIIVSPGVYRGEGNRDIDFKGKAINIRSIALNSCYAVATTIIDCNGTETEPHRGFYFHSGESANSVLGGFTITNGYTDGSGGAIYCDDSSPIITDCVLVANTADAGGAISCFNSDPTIMNCVITGNSSNGTGGLFPSGSGGAVSCMDSNPTIINCTISGNYANRRGGGIVDFKVFNLDDGPTISNCILWSDTPEEIHVFDGAPLVTYCDVQGGWEGTGNINADPQFVTLSCWEDGTWIQGDYHLLPGSPCIDAGDNSAVTEATDLNGNPRIVNTIVDMGAYEHQFPMVLELDLSKTWMYQSLPGQTNSNLIADVSVTSDPMGNSSYIYEWEIILPDDVTIAPTITAGGGPADPCCTFAAPSCNEPDGLSDSGQTFTVRVTVTGADFGNTGIAEAQFGIALLADVNNDKVVNVADRSIINAFWRLDAAGPFTFTDCDINSDGAVNVADRSIANAVWRGVLGQNSVSSPCPLR